MKSGGIEKGQRTLNGTKSPKAKANGKAMDQDHPTTGEEKPSRSAGAPITLVVDRTVDTPPSGASGDQDRDVEMRDQ